MQIHSPNADRPYREGLSVYRINTFEVVFLAEVALVHGEMVGGVDLRQMLEHPVIRRAGVES